MAYLVRFRRSDVPGSKPGDLHPKEINVNVPDRLLYWLADDGSLCAYPIDNLPKPVADGFLDCFHLILPGMCDPRPVGGIFRRLFGG